MTDAKIPVIGYNSINSILSLMHAVIRRLIDTGGKCCFVATEFFAEHVAKLIAHQYKDQDVDRVTEQYQKINHTHADRCRPL